MARFFEEFDYTGYAADLLESQIKPSDPVSWCKEKVGIHLWSKQREVARSVMNNSLTAVKSCHGAGKSFLASLLTAWWVDTHPVEDTIVVTTAPSSRQVQAIIWKEVQKIHRRGKLAGEVQRSARWIIDDLEVAFGRKPQDYDVEKSFQGIHNKYVLVILDEACGINEGLWIAALALATGNYCRILAIGNPDDPTSHFQKVCREGTEWNVIKISAFETPNFTEEKADMPQDALDKLVDQKWVNNMRKAVGEGSSIWKAKVLGEFPDDDDSATIPVGWIHRAQERWDDWMDRQGGQVRGRCVVGVDVARFGGDRTAFAMKVGDVVTEVVKLPKLDTVDCARKVEELMPEGSTAVIDTNGNGVGVYDILNKHGKSVQGVNPGVRLTGEKDKTGQVEYYNNRTKMFWKLREMLDPHSEATLCLPRDPDIERDLSAPTWKNIGGKRVIESKDDVRKRLGRSPDVGDAIMLATWLTTDLDLVGDSAFDWVMPKKQKRGEDDDDDDAFGVYDAVDWQEEPDDWRRIGYQDGVPVI